jgi:predicted RNA-binding Zn-ribbon protein involved in translation (DUF1610 family)
MNGGQRVACASKTRYATRAEGEAEIVRSHQINRDFRPHVTVYYCPSCLGFHIGHAKGSQARRLATRKQARRRGPDGFV